MFFIESSNLLKRKSGKKLSLGENSGWGKISLSNEILTFSPVTNLIELRWTKVKKIVTAELCDGFLLIADSLEMKKLNSVGEF